MACRLLWQEHWHCCSSSRPISSSSKCNNSESCFKLKQKCLPFFNKRISAKVSCGGLKLRPLAALPERNQKQPIIDIDELGNSGVIISSCLVGLLTGIGVVLFNNGVHEIRDFFWDGIPSRGASWLREKPIEAIWTRVILVPTCGGFIVSILNKLRDALDDVQVQNKTSPSHPQPRTQARAQEDVSFPVISTTNLTNINYSTFKVAFQPLLKAVAACITLGTGNSLGPEGPSVEIGKSIAKGVGTTFFDRNPQRKLSLVAAGSAAGIASGFNAAVAGCFFAVESVLWPSPTTDSSTSLTYTTSMVILSAVIASVVSEVGLGSEPAFKVPEYDFRSPGGKL